MRHRLASVRVRVTIAATLAVAVVLAGSGWALLATHRGRLQDNLDNTLRLRADELAAAIASGPIAPGPANREGEVGLYQVVSTDGGILASSANVAGDPPIAGEPPEGGDRLISAEALPIDDDRFRILSRSVNTPSGPVFLHLAASLDPLDESVSELKFALWIGWPTMLAALAGIVWVLVGRTLRPIEDIRSEVAAMTGSELERRVRAPAVDDEVGRLASTMNALLARIEHVTQSQRRFVADASHELRGPLTRLRSELELGIHPPDDAERASLLGEVVGLQRLIEDLLHLARSDAEVGSARTALLGFVDLDDLALDAARSLRARTTLTVDTSAVSGGQIRGHAEQLRRMLANLTANAARYAASTVRLAVHEGATTVELVVEDDGPGIPQHERERVFERFARIDDVRTPGSGAGLGLAIVRDIVDRHGGSVTIDTVSPSGARVVVRFPVSR